MTAVEAREKTLWNNLPKDIKKKIENCISMGTLCCLTILAEDLNESIGGRTVKNILQELGYGVITTKDEEYCKILW